MGIDSVKNINNYLCIYFPLVKTLNVLVILDFYNFDVKIQ